jgi:hypothetical protein
MELPGYPMKDTDPYNSSDTDGEYMPENEPMHDQESDHGNESHQDTLESDNDFNQESNLDLDSHQATHSDGDLRTDDLNDSVSVPSSHSSSEDEEDLASNARPRALPAWMRSGDWDLG